MNLCPEYWWHYFRFHADQRNEMKKEKCSANIEDYLNLFNIVGLLEENWHYYAVIT